jgi:peptidoglycan/LPS O-acetylase OafA/YrhL
MTGIAYGAIVFNSHTSYPGSLVAIPVGGAALVIAGGTGAPRCAAESILKRGPFQWFGKLSYSIYLWHWPLLIIAADAAGTTSLPFRRNIIWLVVALIASVLSFYLVELPGREPGTPCPTLTLRALDTDRPWCSADRCVPDRGHRRDRRPRGSSTVITRPFVEREQRPCAADSWLHCGGQAAGA